MGLYIQTLAGVPDAKRSYYIYLLDYGWYEPLGHALSSNFLKMAEIASQHDAVVIGSIGNRVHFCDSVFSYHNINGENADEVLPAILITNRHPNEFRESFDGRQGDINRDDYKIILFPLKKYCTSTTDVVNYVDRIFKDIVENKDLSDFKIAKEMKKGLGRALIDGILLEPNIAGMGYSFKPLLDYFRDRNDSKI
ncbi:hypothetical protein J2I47_10995 [Fibrella sp. HMF5335]|uniref:Uncharacterized protein n=1 Tax=Fibrella rubiginis TaxID=2817060 RepID=A0A939K1E6_9BACT|nr:hypothetical protein [Fibrella rubiginis]MBO0937072.1 hypothetical protein [Fibrella rubiginis]